MAVDAQPRPFPTLEEGQRNPKFEEEIRDGHRAGPSAIRGGYTCYRETGEENTQASVLYFYLMVYSYHSYSDPLLSNASRPILYKYYSALNYYAL
jgi:hypothetical protein